MPGAAARTTSRFEPLYAVGQPALALQLLEVRLERELRGRAQRGGRVVPHLVEQLVVRAQPARERVEQPALAVEAVRDVLVELRGAGPTRPARGRDTARRRRARAAAAATPCRGRATPPPGAMKTLPSPSTVSPQKSDAAGDERDVVGRVPGRRDHRERPERVAVAQARRRAQPLDRRLLEAAPVRAGGGRPRPATPNRSRSAGTASAWSRCACVSAMPATPPRRSASSTHRARRGRRRPGPGRSPRPARRRATCSCPTA